MSLAPPTHSPARLPAILWDVMEEHLDEAAFFVTQRERTVWRCDHVLDELEHGEDARLLAHLHGLVVGGWPVAERLLLPALEEEDSGRLFVAAQVLLAEAGRTSEARLLEVLRRSELASAAALLRAVELSGNEALDTALPRLLPELTPEVQALALKALSVRRVDVGPVLELLRVGDGTPALAAAVVRAACRSPAPVAAKWVAWGLEQRHSEVRSAAIETGLMVGRREVWARCGHLMKNDGPWERPVLIALAVGGGSTELGRLLEAVQAGSHRSEVLWALGFSGRVEAANASLSVLRESGSPLAAVVFSMITGFVLDARVLEPSDEEAEEGQPLRLPGPPRPSGSVRVEAVEAWWAEAQRRFEPRGRYLYGQPWTPAALFQALERAPLRHRHALAWELEVRSRGTWGLDTCDWAWRQRMRLRAARETAALQTGRFDGFIRA